MDGVNSHGESTGQTTSDLWVGVDFWTPVHPLFRRDGRAVGRLGEDHFFSSVYIIYDIS
jgi:hypothetical protein